VGYFFIGKQKVILFPTFRENRWEGKLLEMLLFFFLLLLLLFFFGINLA
jgi:hypothetical protein